MEPVGATHNPSIAHILLSALLPEPRAGSPVPGSPGIPHRGCGDRSQGKGLPQAVLAPPLPAGCLGKLWPLPLSLSIPDSLSWPDLQSTGVGKERLWLSPAAQRRFSEQSQRSPVLSPLPQHRMTGVPWFWGLACEESLLFVAASGHAAEKRVFAISRCPGLKEKLLPLWKILSMEPHGGRKQQSVQARDSPVAEKFLLFSCYTGLTFSAGRPSALHQSCVWVMLSKLQH